MNKVKITGVFMGVEFSHETHREKCYTGFISTRRNSGIEDMIPITISERLLSEVVETGQRMTIEGEFRSYNKIIDNKNRLILSVFVKAISEPESQEDEDEVELQGFICKIQGLRTTPNGKKIADFTLAVNRVTGRSDYIPCIVWGDKAQYLSTFPIGTEINLLGRIQSREYNKMTSDGVKTKVAYELSVSELGKVEPDTVDLDEEAFDCSDLFSDIDNDDDNK